MKLTSLLFILMLNVLVVEKSVTFGCNVTLTWNASNEVTPTGYKIHIGFPSGNYTTEIDVGNVTEYTVDLPDGRYFAAATAYNTDQNSDYSNEIVFVVNGDTVEEKTKLQRQSSGAISGGSIQ